MQPYPAVAPRVERTSDMVWINGGPCPPDTLVIGRVGQLSHAQRIAAKEDFEERVAIMRICGEMSEREAQWQAARLVIFRWTGKLLDED